MKNGLILNTKILILGSTGQIGESIKKKLNGNIFCPDKSKLNLNNINYLKKYLYRNRFSLIINCAAFTNVNECEKQKKKAFTLNTKLPEVLSKFCKKNGSILIHFSTNYVFDGKKKLRNYNENNKTNPINYYGKTKLLGEKKIIESKCNYLILRVAGVYSKNSKNNFFYKLINNTKKKIYVVDDEIISPCSAEFVSDITLILIKNYNLVKKKILHLTPNGSGTWYKYAKYLFNILNYKKKIYPVKSNVFNRNKAKRPKNAIINSLKLQKILKIKFYDVKRYIRNEYKLKKN